MRGDLLFAYGTLGPSEGDPGEWSEDAIRGRLFDLGPHPLLVGWDDPSAGWVAGHVRPVDRAEMEGELDAYEGVAEDYFRRVRVEARSGRTVWVYVWPRPVPQYARGPLDRWDGPRRDRPTRPPSTP